MLQQTYVTRNLRSNKPMFQQTYGLINLRSNKTMVQQPYFMITPCDLRFGVELRLGLRFRKMQYTEVCPNIGVSEHRRVRT